ncbi:uncharacterized protein BDV17DRAFT_53215 [Aspergillus undulatus]|uniref:uncharacterized protein n=1 Tax=Aspergillus undulatus TaxID=1810928 RepID=UPI003CCD47AE
MARPKGEILGKLSRSSSRPSSVSPPATVGLRLEVCLGPWGPGRGFASPFFCVPLIISDLQTDGVITNHANPGDPPCPHLLWLLLSASACLALLTPPKVPKRLKVDRVAVCVNLVIMTWANAILGVLFQGNRFYGHQLDSHVPLRRLG